MKGCNMDIKHRPIFNVEQAVREYSAQEGVPVRYVATTDLMVEDSPIDVFYRDTPHPEFGNRYFGLYYNRFKESIMICDADRIETMTFAMIQDENGTYHYSQSLHDFVDVGSNFIDGGRDYIRSSGEVTMFRVVDGEFKQIDIDTVERFW